MHLRELISHLEKIRDFAWNDVTVKIVICDEEIPLFDISLRYNNNLPNTEDEEEKFEVVLGEKWRG